MLVFALALLSPASGWTQTFQPPVDSDVEYYHADAVGTVRLVTNAAGVEAARYDYTPFGTPVATSQPLSPDQPRGFAGKEYDAETGLDYFGGRYLLASAARFTTVDPITVVNANLADPQLWNRYSYVRNNPLRYTDPDGRCIWDLCVGEVIAVATALTVVEAAAITAGVVAVAWLASDTGRERTAAGVGAAARLAASGVSEARELVAGSPAAPAPATGPTGATVADARARVYTPGGKFHPDTKQTRAEQAGRKCEYCGVDTVPAQKSQKGVTPPKAEAQTDHYVPAAEGGTNDPANARHACRDCNRKKGTGRIDE